MKFIKKNTFVLIIFILVSPFVSEGIDIIGVKQSDGSLKLSDIFVHIRLRTLKKISGLITGKKKPTTTKVELNGTMMTSTLSLNEKLEVKATENELKAFAEEINTRNLIGKYKIVFIADDCKPVNSYIVIMDYNDKIIVSDIDGTITKSDVRGHVLNGLKIMDWTHPGVAKLFTALSKNGYKFIYLSARPIAMINSTRKYIHNVLQDGFKLPEGPIITNNASILSSVYLELIKKKPQEFKIKCLKNIFSLFAPGAFKYGFGNKETDSIAYSSLDLKKENIIIINKSSQISSPESMVGKNYEQLIDILGSSSNSNSPSTPNVSDKVPSTRKKKSKKTKK